MAQGFDLRHLAICAGSSRVLFCLRSLLPLALLLLPPLALPLLLPPLALPLLLPPLALPLLLPPSAPAAPAFPLAAPAATFCPLLPPRCVLLLLLLFLLAAPALPFFLLLFVLGLEVGQEGWIWGQKNALAAPRGQTGGIRRMIVSALFIYQCYHQVFSVLLG